MPRQSQWSEKVRARQQKAVPMARGHGLKKGLSMMVTAVNNNDIDNAGIDDNDDDGEEEEVDVEQEGEEEKK